MSTLGTATVTFTVGFLAGWVAGRLAKADVPTDAAADPHEAARHWREGQHYGEAKGYADGWTSGRIALVEEQQSRRMHPTGSPESFLKAVDAEADDQMRGLD